MVLKGVWVRVKVAVQGWVQARLRHEDKRQLFRSCGGDLKDPGRGAAGARAGWWRWMVPGAHGGPPLADPPRGFGSILRVRGVRPGVWIPRAAESHQRFA